FAWICSATCTKPGRCFASHVGVNAPGTENSTTFLPLKSSSVVTSFGPSLVIVLSLPEGIRSPALIAILSLRITPREGDIVNHRREGLVAQTAPASAGARSCILKRPEAHASGLVESRLCVPPRVSGAASARRRQACLAC